MHLEEFSEGDSFFHHIDPRIKLVVFIPLAFSIALSRSINIGWAWLFLAVLTIVWAKVSFKAIFGRLLIVNTFILFLWLTLPFSMEGRILIYIGRLKITYQGIIYTLGITLKANAIFLFTISILGTSEIVSLAHALIHLKVPKKIVWLFFLFYRYISVVHREYDRLISAVKVRGFGPKTGLYTYKTYAYLLGMLFIRSYERSQRVYQALLLRGFKGNFPLFSHFRLQRIDIFFCLSSYCIIILTLFFNG
jgi:cobalt/nickel transport system permease protein